MGQSFLFEIILIAIMFIIILLCATTDTFRYFLKVLIYSVYVGLVSGIVIPIILFRPKNVKNFVLLSSLYHRVSSLMGLNYVIRGKEHIEKEKACIIVANHQSFLDFIGMFHVWHLLGKCTIVAHNSIFLYWPFGLACWLSGIIYIDLNTPGKAISTINKATGKLKTNKIKMWIYPESLTRNTGEIHKFKKGAFHAAINTQLPILPVVFSSYYHFMSETEKFDSGRIIMTILPPISTEGLTTEDVTDLTEKTRLSMCEVFESTKLEILQSLMKIKKES